MKKILILVLVAALVLALVGCGNRQLIDTTRRFDYAVIQLPNGAIVEGAVESWMDYEDGDQIQVKIDGITYLVHSSDVALMAE